MRILFVVHQFMPESFSGTEQVTLSLAKLAQRQGNYVEVLTCSNGNLSLWDHVSPNGLLSSSVDGVPVNALPAARSELVNLGLTQDQHTGILIASFFHSRPAYDLVHVTHSMRLHAVFDVLRERRIPYLVTLTDFFMMCYRTNLIRRSHRSCSGPRGGTSCEEHCNVDGLPSDAFAQRHERLRANLFGARAVVACSQFVSERFEQEYPGLKPYVIEHGIDLFRFSPLTVRRERPLVFGFLGSIQRQKGILILADAFVAAAPEEARLAIVGPPDDAELCEQLQKMAERTGRVMLAPPVNRSEVAQVLSGFDVLCIPSLVPESFSLVLQEGFAAGLPCLVSDRGNPARIVRDAACGRVIEAGNVAHWARAISDISRYPSVLERWRQHLPLPRTQEEEAFMYAWLYRNIIGEAGEASVMEKMPRDCPPRGNQKPTPGFAPESYEQLAPLVPQTYG